MPPVPQLLRPPPSEAVALDIETTGLSIFHDHVTAVTLSTGDWTSVTDVRDMERETVAEWLRSVYQSKIIVHNGQFDLTFIRQFYGVDYPTSVFDTMVAETLLTAGLYDIDEEDGSVIGPMSRSLQAAVLRRLGQTISKDQEIRIGFQLDNEWTREMLDYAAADAAILVPLYHAQRQLIIDAGMATVARIEMRCVPIFCEMQRRGIVVDTGRLKPLIDEASTAAAGIEKQLQALLTPHLYWGRMRQQQGADAELEAWRSRYDEAMHHHERYWTDCVYSLDKDAHADEWRQQWLDVTIDGSAKPITDTEIVSWFAEKVSRGRVSPDGCRRYVKRMMQHWRTQEGNARPPAKVIDIQELMNIRSVPQKMAAIASYVSAYNKQLKTNGDAYRFEMPDNLQRKTLVAVSVDSPDDLQTLLLTPLIEFSKLDKLVSAFGPPLAALLVPELRGEAQALHGGWRQVGTATGRPTCSRPNLAQMPSDPRFRSCFRAREGCCLIVADYSQIELRILAEMSGDPELRRAFVEGLDLHTQTAVNVLGADPTDVADKLRKVAKIINFGIVYGMRENALRRQLAGNPSGPVFITKEQAKEYLGKWRRQYAVASVLIEDWGLKALSRGYAETYLGRRRYFDIPKGGLRGFLAGKIEREGANHPVQGCSADITKLAMSLVQPELVKLGGSLVLQLYDELVAEVPEEHAEVAAALVRSAMAVAAGAVLKTVPCKIDCVVSPSWNESESAGP